MERFKRGWMTFVHWLGRVQTALILFLIYVLVIGPVWFFLWVTRRSDLLAIKKPADGITWSIKPRIPTDIERCERQF
jgi:maltodextrin utilization protein YvdJ